ncbi:MAG: type II secretion system F family protein [Campylobacterota bacterium]|nr:type II secretion system F family protein [Campylobacterota bacterium]
MAFFIVYIIDDEGKKLIEGFEANNKGELYQTLDQNNNIPLKIYPLHPKLMFLSKLFEPKVTTDQIIQMLDNLNIILKAGIPLAQGLHDIKEDAENAQEKKLLTKIANQVSSGTKFSTACEPYKKQFTQTIINLMAVGEETGQIETTLRSGADFLRKTQELKKNTKKALITPLFSIGFIFMAVVAWMLFVVPGMVGFFKDMDTELPALTKFLIAASEFFTEYIGMVIMGIIGTIIIFKTALEKSDKFRYAFLKLALKTPVFSKMMVFFNIAYIADYLKLSLSSGLTLYDALIMLQGSIENDLYKEDLEKIIKGLEQGVPLSAGVRSNPLYTNFVTRVVEIGETTGSLENELGTIAETYFTKVQDISDNIPKIVQPLTLMIGGGFMALIMTGLMGPIYDLIAQM